MIYLISVQNNDQKDAYQAQKNNTWTKLEFQETEKARKYWIEIIEVKNTVTELKT